MQLDGLLRWALWTWCSAASFSELGGVLHDVRHKTSELAAASEAMATELERLQLAETGGLAIGQLQLLHETATEVRMIRATHRVSDPSVHSLLRAPLKLLHRVCAPRR